MQKSVSSRACKQLSHVSLLQERVFCYANTSHKQMPLEPYPSVWSEDLEALHIYGRLRVQCLNMTQAPQISIHLGEVLTFKLTPVGKRNSFFHLLIIILVIFIFAVISITCASQHLRCLSRPWNPCQGQVITMWWTMRVLQNTTCPALLLSLQQVDGQGEHLEKRMFPVQVRDFHSHL